MISLAAVLFGCVLFLGPSLAEPDCKNKLAAGDMEKCCHVPEANWGPYASECGDFPKVREKFQNPCAVACLFNVTKSLEGEQINIENIRTMVSQMYSDNEDFAQAYVLGFEKCLPLMAEKMAKFKAGGRVGINKQFGTFNCSPKPVIYAYCAHRMVMISCPAVAWTSSPTCEKSKEFAISCMNELGVSTHRGGRMGGHDRGAGIRFNRHRHQHQIQEQLLEQQMTMHEIWADLF